MINRDTIKFLLNRLNGTIASITFVKMDGTTRKLQIQQDALRTNAKGAAASPSAQQAVKTRAANNPHLFNVWAVKIGNRCVNLDTVSRVACRGYVYSFSPTAGYQGCTTAD